MPGYWLSLGVLLYALGHNSCSGGTTLDPFPFGTIGCLVADVCESGQVCTNDLLFGSCQSFLSRVVTGDIKFHLERREIRRLEEEIKHLISDGFTWKDAFTQCALQNTLLDFTRGRLFDLRKCEEALGVTSPDYIRDMNEEIAKVLLKLVQDGDLDLNTLEDLTAADEERAREDDLLASSKRDEIVKVHKYFDRSTGQLKRDRYGELEDDPQFVYISDDDSLLPLRRKLGRYYLESQQNRQTDEGPQTFPNFETSIDGNQLTGVTDGNQEPRDFVSQSETSDIPVDDALLQEPVPTPTNGDVMEEVLQQDQTVSDDDEKILEHLLDGTLKPEDLNSEQQDRMQAFIEKLIKVLDVDSGAREGDMTHQLVPDTEPSKPDDIMGTGSEDMDNKDGGEDVDEQTEGQEMSKKSLHAIQPEQLAAYEMGEMPPPENDVIRIEDQNGDRSDRDRHIDSNFLYVTLSHKVDRPTAILFVHNLTEMLGIPADTFGMIEVVRDNVVDLGFNPSMATEQDAENVVNQILKKKDAIKDKTGVDVEHAGVGLFGHGVEFKQNNRYVVLTFILVGSIAGVMLAVVTVYLIKRHAHSKQKLAQLAADPDAVEVSKDYQDLCRQRMQGKTSEKPEPLHAASRIGSTSESQVRSPSSRSSTSSWSEEPAANNMDISTGHIVLSYMEDHLKNQDRLDQEWEAVSSYVADPASSKVAAETSNARKNRYADVMPYDHSRVILSSNANVASCDYINASFITDHDPRNPAYICTQGPLPHTVADFWQMIWEQGSVVIVMLTKLSENGTSLCHRYWPEEGSDLYHIYEVHLVSEHIWCDDYLVRSFYLKNLQTNETRTVTQFHFLTWPQLSVPASIKTLLDFRRKVNKSFRGRSCPIVVHCSDGCGRSGTYCLVDMVLNKMAKGAKEIDMAATLEHIRDQRMNTVKTKEQFQFSLAAVAEEVHAILKALPQ